MSPDARTPAERADAVARAADAAAAAVARAAHHGDVPAPPAHEAGAAARLLAATSELEAEVARARAQLDPLDDALRRIGPASATSD